MSANQAAIWTIVILSGVLALVVGFAYCRYKAIRKWIDDEK